MPNESLIAKTSILGRNIAEDQQEVAQQWLKTFKHNSKDDVATNMAMLVLACVAEGNFRTRSSLVSPELSAPSNALTAVDYLSHASRIIIDYKGLSPELQNEFLAYFPKDGGKGVISRSATHAVQRKTGGIVELKGLGLGLAGQLPTFIKTPLDFGVNIAMGGSGQTNLVGKKITANGYSGHVYFHHFDQLMMFGLEQSAPAASIYEAIVSHTHSSDEQSGTDQFGQGHSLVGASDTYTAAGSLYFSDPVYQAKLITETGTVPPDKYGAMQVTLTDENWAEIKKYLTSLQSELDASHDQIVLRQITQPPKTAVTTKPTITSFIALDFNAYLSRINLFLDEVAESDRAKVKAEQSKLQMALLSHIGTVQKGKADKDTLKALQTTITGMGSVPHTPYGYKEAISRIQKLFGMQLTIDPELTKTHTSFLINQKREELLNKLSALEKKAQMLQDLFSSDYISQEGDVRAYLGDLMTVPTKLAAVKSALDIEMEPTVKPKLEKIEGKEEKKEDEKPTGGKPEITLELLETQQGKLLAIEDVLNKPPHLVSVQKSAMLENELLQLRKRFDALQSDSTALTSDLRSKLQSSQEQLVLFDQTKGELVALHKEMDVLRTQLNEVRNSASQEMERHKQNEQELQQRLKEAGQKEKDLLSELDSKNKNLKVNEEVRSKLESDLTSNTSQTQALHAKEQELREANHQLHLSQAKVKELESRAKETSENSTLRDTHVLQRFEEAQQLHKQEKLALLAEFDQERNRLKTQISALEKEKMDRAANPTASPTPDTTPKQSSEATKEQEEVAELRRENERLKAEQQAQQAKELALTKKTASMASIFYNLEQVEKQSRKLLKEGHQDAYNAANDLVESIREEIEDYLQKPNPSQKDLKDFQGKCTAYIDKAEEVLQNHRGWKRLFANLFLCILGLGIGYGAAGAINYYRTGNFLFFNQTNSMKKVDDLKQSLDSYEMIPT